LPPLPNEIPGRCAAPSGLCDWLRAHGHDAEHVFDIGLCGSTDLEILHRAPQAKAVLVSKDEDIARLSPAGAFALLWLRCGNVTNAALASWLDQRWGDIEQLLSDGERMIEVR
jgi:predicted nuclease of predicted toxin-antitoxin system